jgi:transposase InsO family protein
MRATANVMALEMALKSHPPPEIHHSDRGSQYTYKGYIDLLKYHKSKISMSLSAQENAYAERINRTIKEEYLDYWKPKSFNQLKRYVRKAVENYYNKRPHNHIGNCSPTKYEKQWNQLDENLKPKITIFNNEIIV